MSEISILLLIVCIGYFFITSIHFYFIAVLTFFKHINYFKKADLNTILKDLNSYGSFKQQLFVQALHFSNILLPLMEGKLEYAGKQKLYIKKVVELKAVYSKHKMSPLLAIIASSNEKYFSVVKVPENKNAIYGETDIIKYDNYNSLCYASTEGVKKDPIKACRVFAICWLLIYLAVFVLWIYFFKITLKEIFKL